MYRNWTELIKPKKIDVDERTLTSTYGKFYGEPFERGFGVTIGNSLRRILLSSLQGAAITAVRIAGVLHEFSTIPGVKEDVTDVVLNLKQVRLKMSGSTQETLRISAKGENVIRASHIQAPPTVEILNPEHVILSMAKDSKIEMEMIAKTGRGFVPAERNKNESDPIGTIPIDSTFCPIRKVDFTLTNARVGQRTDYERLVLEVWTDGSVHPSDAVGFSAKIIQDQMGIFVPFEEIGRQPELPESKFEGKFDEKLFRSVEELGLSPRTVNCLVLGGIRYVGELVQKAEQELLKTKKFGRMSLNEVKEVFAGIGLSLGTKLEGFPSREELERHSKLKESQAG
jgi:DNA-directed RNA polymerase subunit alpha